MTEPEIQPPPARVEPEPGSRLQGLHARYAQAKADADAAAAALKTVTDGIKAELQALAPEARRIVLPGTQYDPELGMTYVESWRIDSTRLKRENPELYVRYAKQSGSWRLAPTRGDDE